MKISNPVLRGFHPDPSIIRVGETYYIATSTFEWWPGIRIYQSTNLAEWGYLCSAIDTPRLADLRGVPSSGGIWAPDLSYADNKFWLVYSVMDMVDSVFRDGVNYLTWADNITGPWADPVALNSLGFDPSLFHDDDGRKYLVQQTWDHREYHHRFNGITLTELDPTTVQLLPSTSRTIWKGSEVKLTEGPHLYKIHGWYYLFAAEGGTTYNHQETVARSRSLEALSFQAMPGSYPFLGNYDTPYSYLQKQGHGSLASTPSSDWYYASLCARPWHHQDESVIGPRGWCTLGRETAIQKVEWDTDGWPHIAGGHSGQRYVEGPHISGDEEGCGDVEEEQDNSSYDDFTGPDLDPQWNTLRRPFDSSMGRVGDGVLTLVGHRSLHNLFDVSMIARRWQAFEFTAETKISFLPDHYQAMAGLVNYYNNTNFSWIFITWDEERHSRVIEVAQSDQNKYTSYLQDQAIEVPQGADVWFRTMVSTDSYTYAYSFDGIQWEIIPVSFDASILSDDYVFQTSDGYFTGAFVGLAAVDYSGYESTARFSYFDYCEKGSIRSGSDAAACQSTLTNRRKKCQ